MWIQTYPGIHKSIPNFFRASLGNDVERGNRYTVVLNLDNSSIKYNCIFLIVIGRRGKATAVVALDRHMLLVCIAF